LKSIIIPLKRDTETSVSSVPSKPRYISASRGLCRATGGIAHSVSEYTDSKGRKYWHDDVTDKKVYFEKSVTQLNRDHEMKIYRRVMALCEKAEKTGLTANEFSQLTYYHEDESVQRNYSVLSRIERIMFYAPKLSGRFDAGKLLTRRSPKAKETIKWSSL
jgi:hypothetical protein